MRRLFQIICIGCVATIIISCGNSGSQAKSGEEANQVEQKANAGTPTTPSFTPTTPIVKEDDSIPVFRVGSLMCFAPIPAPPACIAPTVPRPCRGTPF